MTNSIKKQFNFNKRLITKTHSIAKLSAAKILLKEIESKNYSIADVVASLNHTIQSQR